MEPPNTEVPLKNSELRPCTEELSPGSKSFWISKNSKEQGLKGEEYCQRWLQSQGFAVIKTNWRTPYGEVDLVCSQGKSIFILEVKTRAYWVRGKTNIISWQQRQRLHRAAMWIWQKMRGDFFNFKCRILVVTHSNIEIENLPLLYDHN